MLIDLGHLPQEGRLTELRQIEWVSASHKSIERLRGMSPRLKVNEGPYPLKPLDKPHVEPIMQVGFGPSIVLLSWCWAGPRRPKPSCAHVDPCDPCGCKENAACSCLCRVLKNPLTHFTQCDLTYPLFGKVDGFRLAHSCVSDVCSMYMVLHMRTHTSDMMPHLRSSSTRLL